MIPKAVLALLFAAGLFAQQRVPAEFMYHRVWAVIPMAGSGKGADAFRPSIVEIAPAAAPAKPSIGAAPTPTAVRPGILGMQMWTSDDGKFALVELVAADPAAFSQLLNSTDPNVQVFERGKTTQAQVEQAFQKYKKDFKFNPVNAVRVQ